MMRLRTLERKFFNCSEVRYFFPLANEYRRRYQLNECIEVLRTGLNQYPNYWAARVALGRALFERGDYEAALFELEPVACHIPENLLMNGLLASLYLKKGNLAKAVHHAKVVLFVNPYHRESINIIKEVEKKQAIVSDKPIDLAKPTLTKGENQLELERINTLQQVKQIALAKPTLTKGENQLELEPINTLQQVKQIIPENPDDDEKKDNNPKRNDSAKSYQESDESQCCSLQSDDKEMVTATLAELYLSQGFPEEAICIYEKLIKIQPEHGAEWKQRIDDLKRKGDFHTSVEYGLVENLKLPQQKRETLQELERWLTNIEKLEREIERN